MRGGFVPLHFAPGRCTLGTESKTIEHARPCAGLHGSVIHALDIEQARRSVAVHAYMAGFFDGEGCVTIRKRGHRWEAHLRFIGTDFPLMHWLSAVTGVGLSRRRPAKPHYKPSFEVCLQHNRAEEWALRMLPYSFIKHDELTLLLRFRETIRENGHNRPVLEHIQQERRQIIWSCAALKSRRWDVNSFVSAEA